MEDIDLTNYTGVDSSAAENAVDTTNTYQDTPVEYASPVKSEEPTNPQAENFRAFREEVDRLKAEREAERRDFQMQMDILRANVAQKQEHVKEQKFLGNLADNDVPNVAELRMEYEQREANLLARMEELQVQQLHPDYVEVIEKYTIPLIKEKPHLAEGLTGASNKAMYAYELGQMAQKLQNTVNTSQKSESAQRMVDNSRKPGTLSQAGGQGALSKADYFATMSDQEFMRLASRNLEQV